MARLKGYSKQQLHEDYTLLLSARELDNKILDNDALSSIINEINIEIEDAVLFAKNSSEPELEESLKDIYTDIFERDNLV